MNLYEEFFIFVSFTSKELNDFKEFETIRGKLGILFVSTEF